MLRRFCVAILLLVFPFLPCPQFQQRNRKNGQRAEPCEVPCHWMRRDIDRKLNRRKNIRTAPTGAAKDMTIAQMEALDDPVQAFAKGDKRDALTALGEGQTY